MILKSNQSFVAAVLLAALSQTASASHWYGSANLGLGAAQIGKTETLNLFTTSLPPITDTYVADHKYRFAGLLGVGAGYRFNEMRSITWSFGGSFSYLTYGTIRGSVHPLTNIANNFDRLS